jgi:hypothetical protein
MATQSLPSLYDRVGGVYSIATVVDDLTRNCGNYNEADYLLRRW